MKRLGVWAALGALFFSGSLAMGAETGTGTAGVLHVSAFGAVGDGETDDGPAVAAAMEALRAHDGPVVLRFAAGQTYRIATLPGAGMQEPVFGFSEASDKEVDGNGAHFVLRFPLDLIAISKSRRIALHSFSFTYDPLPFTQGHMQAIDQEAGTFDVKVQPGFPLPKFDAPGVHDNSVSWQFCWTFSPSCHVWTRTIKEIDAEHTAQGVFRVTVRDDRRDVLPLLMEGDRRIVVPTLGTVDGVPQRSSGTHSAVTGSEDIRLQYIHQHVSPHFSFLIAYNTGKIEIRNVDIHPPEASGRWLSSWRDGFHVKTNAGPIVVEDCDMAWLRDDCINISAIALTIEEQLDDRTYQFRVTNREGFPTLEPGFTVEGWNVATGKHCGEAVIEAVEPGTGTGYWNTVLRLDQPLANVVPDGESTSFWVHEYCNAGSLVRNNRFDGSVRFRSPGRYENNLITEFMIVKPDAFENPLNHDMVLRGNTLPMSGIPTVFCVYRGEAPTAPPPHHEDAPSERLVRNLVLEDNEFGRPIYLFDATGVTIRGNRLMRGLPEGKALILRNTSALQSDLSEDATRHLD